MGGGGGPENGPVRRETWAEKSVGELGQHGEASQYQGTRTGSWRVRRVGRGEGRSISWEQVGGAGRDVGACPGCARCMDAPPSPSPALTLAGAFHHHRGGVLRELVSGLSHCGLVGVGAEARTVPLLAWCTGHSIIVGCRGSRDCSIAVNLRDAKQQVSLSLRGQWDCSSVRGKGGSIWGGLAAC